MRFSLGKMFENKGLKNPLLIFLSLIISLLLIGAVHGADDVLAQNISPQNINVAQDNPPTVIYDRNGEILYELPRDRDFDYVPLKEISPRLIDAVLAVEDHKFYEHGGIRPLSMLRALYFTIRTGELQGGSTITQQMVKNTLLTRERTLSRKLREVLLSLKVEEEYSKEKILELYLNHISFGGTAWGAQSAAEKYFDKDAVDLDLAEASLLAGLPKAPSLYSPLNDMEAAKERQRFVLERMVETGFITTEKSENAYEKELQIAPQVTNIRAPHFVYYIIDKLSEEFGEERLRQGGLTIRTTLDLQLQEKVKTVVEEELVEAEPLNISNAAVIILDNETNGVLTYLGSRDFFYDEFGQYDVIQAERQLGSAVKPATYSLLLENGKYTAASILKDTPLQIRQSNGDVYRPQNYDKSFHGNVTVRQALANSYNIPALRVARELGPKNIVEHGISLGMKSWQGAEQYGLAVTLGAVEGSLMDLTNVFSTLSRYGKYNDLVAISEVKEDTGKVIYQDEKNEKQVLSEEASYLISDILADSVTRAAAFGYNNPLNFGNEQVAVKTGTSDEKRDNYTVGYTTDYIVGVWVGNNDNTRMHPRLASGLSGAAPIWRGAFDILLEGKEEEHRFPIPEDIYIFVDEECHGESEKFIQGSNQPQHLCLLDKENGEDENGDDDE